MKLVRNLFVLLALFLIGCAKPEPDKCPRCSNPFIHAVELMGPKAGQRYIECHKCNLTWDKYKGWVDEHGNVVEE